MRIVGPRASLPSRAGVGPPHDAAVLATGLQLPWGLVVVASDTALVGADVSLRTACCTSGSGTRGTKELARDMTSLAGKTLRIRPDATVPADNPLRGGDYFQVDLNAANYGQTVGQLFGTYGRIRTVAVAPDGALWLTTGNNSVSFPHTAEDDRVIRVLPGVATTAPTAVTASVVSASSATLAWAPPTSTGGSAVTGYRVRALRASSSGAVLSTTLSAWQAATVRSLAMTLPQTGNYRFTVEARNAVGTGAQSARSNQIAGR